ncbi:MAG: hypothetical protein HOY71_52995, partial [Nonomuraea sp.]|nr:hypothetical protein [Nonomuraea sp.]
MADRLGGYWLGARLGSGEAYEAYDESGLRHALHLRESAAAEAALEVRSVHVANLVEVTDGHVVAEYVSGMSLRAAVAEHGPYSGGDLYRLATATATALAAIHEVQAVHGGLNPDRVLLTAQGPKLIGLGLAAGTPAADVLAWGQLLLFAAGGPDGMDRSLRALVASAVDRNAKRRPGARQLLLSLLDTPQSQLGQLLPPREVHDPALGELAEEVYQGLSQADQDLAAEVFLRLPCSREDLLAGRAPARVTGIERVLKAFGDAGLLSDPPDRAELLEIAWPRLREWLDGEREGLAVHRELARAARRWEAGGRPESELFRGEELERALAWAAGARRHLTLNGDEKRFLDAGRASG